VCAGEHRASDVVAGAALGAAIGIAVGRFALARARQRTSDGARDRVAQEPAP